MTKKGLELQVALTRRGLIPAAISDYQCDALSCLCSAATTYDRYQIEACNGDRFESMEAHRSGSWQRWLDKADERYERVMSRHASALGLTLNFQGDPRGYCVRVVDPKRPDDGVGVPGLDA